MDPKEASCDIRRWWKYNVYNMGTGTIPNASKYRPSLQALCGGLDQVFMARVPEVLNARYFLHNNIWYQSGRMILSKLLRI